MMWRPARSLGPAFLLLLCASSSLAGWGVTDAELIRRLRLRVEAVDLPGQMGPETPSLEALALRASEHVRGPVLVLFLASEGSPEGERPEPSAAVAASTRLAQLLDVEGVDACAVQANAQEVIHVAFRLFRILSVDVSRVPPAASPAVNRDAAPALVLRSTEGRVVRAWAPGEPVGRSALLDGMMETLGPGTSRQRLAREGYEILDRAWSFVRLLRQREAAGEPDRLDALRVAIREGEARIGARQHVDLDPWSLDGVDLVYVPHGRAVVGSASSPPRRTVDVTRSFLIGRYEVTNAQYAAFLADSGYDGAAVHPSSREPYLCMWANGSFGPGRDRDPICCVNWHHARAYCDWLSAKTRRRVRLPTEAEWEYVARGDEGRAYPWGDSWDPSACNWGDGGTQDGFATASPVGSFPAGATDLGVYDLAGNVWEWCADEVRGVADDIGTGGPDEDPARPRRPLRGGPWCLGAEALRSDHPWYADPTIADDKIGFRILVEIETR